MLKIMIMLVVNVDLMFALDILNFHCCLIITMNVGNKILLQRNEIGANYVRIIPWIAKRQKPVHVQIRALGWGDGPTHRRLFYSYHAAEWSTAESVYHRIS